jgi:parvulin-like peptidyl-prolyl isomerase
MAVVYISMAGSCAFASWPFTSVNMAKVGDHVITVEDYEASLTKLHKSERAGKKLSASRSLVKFDYSRHLNEMIDSLLILNEAESMELYNEPGFKKGMDLFIINFSLQALFNEEVAGKVKITDAEVKAFEEDYLKKLEQGLIEEEDEGKDGTPHKESIMKSRLRTIKTEAREKAYFDKLRSKGRVKVVEEVMETLSNKMDNPEETVVAHLNGKPIYAIEMLRAVPAKRLGDEDARSKGLDKVVLNKLLDAEVLRKGYAKRSENMELINKEKERRLIYYFKRNIIMPGVKVDETDVKEYYEANMNFFISPDQYKLSMIQLWKIEDAEAVIKELKEGADFAYIAETKSIGPGKEAGGDIGWSSIDSMSRELVLVLAAGKKGDVFGPFAMKHGVNVFKYDDFKKGNLRSLDTVYAEILATLTRDMFISTMKKYLDELREMVPVEINEEELKRLSNG